MPLDELRCMAEFDIPDALLPDDPSVEVLVFGDGSAFNSSTPRWRLAGSALWCMQTDFEWRSPLPGLLQTITRAELYPLVRFLEKSKDKNVHYVGVHRSLIFSMASSRDGHLKV